MGWSDNPSGLPDHKCFHIFVMYGHCIVLRQMLIHGHGLDGVSFSHQGHFRGAVVAHSDQWGLADKLFLDGVNCLITLRG